MASFEPDSTHEKWASVFAAVKSFIGSESDEFKVEAEIPTNHAESDDRRLTKIAEGISKLELMLSLGERSTSTLDKDAAEVILDNNRELALILKTLKSTFPAALNELLLVSEEERSSREELQADLDLTRLKWKSEVATLQELLADKTSNMSYFSSMHSARGGALSEESTLRRRLGEAEAEIRQLREVITNSKSAR